MPRPKQSPPSEEVKRSTSLSDVCGPYRRRGWGSFRHGGRRPLETGAFRSGGGGQQPIATPPPPPPTIKISCFAHATDTSSQQRQSQSAFLCRSHHLWPVQPSHGIVGHEQTATTSKKGRKSYQSGFIFGRRLGRHSWQNLRVEQGFVKHI